MLCSPFCLLIVDFKSLSNLLINFFFKQSKNKKKKENKEISNKNYIKQENLEDSTNENKCRKTKNVSI